MIISYTKNILNKNIIQKNNIKLLNIRIFERNNVKFIQCSTVRYESNTIITPQLAAQRAAKKARLDELKKVYYLVIY